MSRLVTPMGMLLDLGQTEKSFVEVYVKSTDIIQGAEVNPPIKGALVAVIGRGFHVTARTDAKGKARLEVPVAKGENVLLFVEKSGYFGDRKDLAAGETHVLFLPRKPGELVAAAVTPIVLLALGSAGLGAGLVYLFSKKS